MAGKRAVGISQALRRPRWEGNRRFDSLNAPVWQQSVEDPKGDNEDENKHIAIRKESGDPCGYLFLQAHGGDAGYDHEKEEEAKRVV